MKTKPTLYRFAWNSGLPPNQAIYRGTTLPQIKAELTRRKNYVEKHGAGMSEEGKRRHDPKHIVIERLDWVSLRADMILALDGKDED